MCRYEGESVHWVLWFGMRSELHRNIGWFSLKPRDRLVGNYLSSMTDMDTSIHPCLYLYLGLLEECGSSRKIELVELVLMSYGKIILYLSLFLNREERGEIESVMLFVFFFL